MSDVVIRANDVSKLYRLGVITTGTIVNDFNRLFRKITGGEDPLAKVGATNDRLSGNGSEFVWALKDIGFEVRRGDVLAIIGKNGAGKSTLLKILSRVTSPTTGSILVRGRIASLLEVGTGFHQELTGRENIFLNGSILGMTKNEIKKKFDEIVDFSGIGNYIDTPVKRYSSGMYVRLAFAVAAHLEPEILIVDEVLAVGDAEFQNKCIGKMQDVSKNEGRTVLFVSHNMAAVKNLCTTGMILEYGSVKYSGDVESCIANYLSAGAGAESGILAERKDRIGSGVFRFTDLKFRGPGGEEVTQVISGEKLTAELSFCCADTVRGNLIVAVHFQDMFGNARASFVTDEMGIKLPDVSGEGKILLEIPKVLLRAENYVVRLFASVDTTTTENVLDSIDNVARLTVIQGDYWKSGKLNRRGSYSLIDGEFKLIRT